MPKVEEPTSPLEPVSENGDVNATVAVDGSANGDENGQQAGAGNKRFRPAPAKTFQCRGYGDCRMVFSRSEHLARHIRKHTGERPFTCHCGKQFSRLDNLRQHAQTVHADKAEQNERMMRDLTSLHASMAAANKASQQRGKRAAAAAAAAAVNGGNSRVKQEEEPLPQLYRPGTAATGYESFSQWQQPPQADMDRPNRTQPSPFSPVDSTGSPPGREPSVHDYRPSQRSSPLSPNPNGFPYNSQLDVQQLPRQRTSPPSLPLIHTDHAQDQSLAHWNTAPYYPQSHSSIPQLENPSLADSPSWTSAIQTPTQIPIEPFYPRPQDTRQAQHHARAQQQSSSRVQLSSHSAILAHHQPPPPPHHHSYSQEIARQQQAQLRQLQQAQQAAHAHAQAQAHHRAQQQVHRHHYEDPAASYPLYTHHPPPPPPGHPAFYGLEQAMYAQATDDQRSLLSTPPL
ncbi:unnamed protein product [Peniophora sp. CBMAI 1063]|nr:unnamed protein product [Peniophora sp. CBMAI 1063]